MRAQVSQHWPDAALLEEVPRHGEEWAKEYVLWAILHQRHHRAQITVLMRQAGLKVSGIDGPAREERTHMNLPPME